MSRSIERQLKSMNPRSLYRPSKWRKNSEADAMLLNSLTILESNSSIIQQQLSNNNNNDNPTTTMESATEVRPGSNKNKNKIPTISSNLSSSSYHLHPNYHNYDKLPQQHQSSNLTATSSSKSVLINLSEKSDQQKSSSETNESTSNAIPKSETSPASKIDNSSNNNNKNDRRLSRLLREVNERREIRDRHDSYASDVSLEANMLKNKELEQKKISKIQRSKRLLFKYKIYDFLKRPASFGAMIYHVLAFLLVFACLLLSIYPPIGTEIGKVSVSKKVSVLLF